MMFAIGVKRKIWTTVGAIIGVGVLSVSGLSPSYADTLRNNESDGSAVAPA